MLFDHRRFVIDGDLNTGFGVVDFLANDFQQSFQRIEVDPGRSELSIKKLLGTRRMDLAGPVAPQRCIRDAE